MYNMALNHEVTPEDVDGELVYGGPSPDEVAFVYFGRHMGYRYIERTRTQLTLEVDGKKEVWDILNVLGLVARASASVICRKAGVPKGSKLMVYSKGADKS